MGVELLKIPAKLAPSGNPMNFKVRAGNYAIEGHQLTAQIQIETVPDSGIFHALPVMNLDPDETGVADLDVSTIIHRRMQTELPAFEDSRVTRLLKSTIRYKVLFSEYYGEQSATKETSILTAIKCRLNFYNYPLETIEDYVVQGKNYLSHRPEIIETRPGEIHYLVVLALYTDTYTVKLSALYTDGSEDTIDLHTFTPVTEYNVFAIPSGLKHLNLAKPGVSLVSYTIWVENSSNEIAFKKVTFKVFPYNPANRCFLFGNLLGGIDTVITESQSDSLKVERETFQKYLPMNYKANCYNITTFVSGYTNIFEASTGYISRKLAEVCKEMAISETVFLVGMKSFIAVNIDKGTFDIANDKEDLQSFSFKYSPAFEKDLIFLSVGASESYSDNDYNEDYD